MPDPTSPLDPRVVDMDGQSVTVRLPGGEVRMKRNPETDRALGIPENARVMSLNIGQAQIESQGDPAQGSVRVMPLPSEPRVQIGQAQVESQGDPAQGSVQVTALPPQPHVTVGPAQIEQPPQIRVTEIPTTAPGVSDRVIGFDRQSIRVVSPTSGEVVNVARTPGLERMLGIDPQQQSFEVPSRREALDRVRQRQFDEDALRPIPPRQSPRQPRTDAVVPSGFDLNYEEIAQRLDQVFQQESRQQQESLASDLVAMMGG